MNPDPNAKSHAGHHSDHNGPFEVFWSSDGWFYRTSPTNEPQGPFETSHDAYRAVTEVDGFGHGPV